MKSPLTIQEHKRLAEMIQHREVSELLENRFMKSSMVYRDWWRLIRAVENLRCALDDNFFECHKARVDGKYPRSPYSEEQREKEAK